MSDLWGFGPVCCFKQNVCMARLIERAPAGEIFTANRIEKPRLFGKPALQIVGEGGKGVASAAGSGQGKGIAKTRGAVDLHRIGGHAPPLRPLQLNASIHDWLPWMRCSNLTNGNPFRRLIASGEGEVGGWPS